METITQLKYVDGNVLIAGLSNEEFSSSLRSIPFPFQAASKGAGIEIWHGSHGRFETKAPVRTFVPYEINGEKAILAAYTCTPLVRIPVSELKAGNKVKGTTIAELGNRNKPIDMIVYAKDGKHYILMANSSRGVMKLTADHLEGYQPITKQTEVTGVPYETIAGLKGVQHLDKYDDANALVLMGEGAVARPAHGAAAVVLALLLLAAIQFDGGVFRVTGWEAGAEPPAGWSSFFSVYAGPAGAAIVPPLLGTYSVEAASLVFRPRFPLSPGMHVRAVFQPPDGPAVESVFDIPAAVPVPSTTRVAQVYPSTDTSCPPMP